MTRRIEVFELDCIALAFFWRKGKERKIPL